MDGEGKAFRDAQSAAIDELYGDAVAAQADVAQQKNGLLAGQDCGEAVVVLGADLGEDFPLLVLDHSHEEELRSGGGLANGSGLPAFDGFDVKEVIAQHLFGHLCGITLGLLVDEAHLAVVGVPGAGSVEVQSKVLGEAQHRGVWVRVVVERIALGGSREGAQSRWELLVTCFVGSLVGRRGFGWRRFGLALATVGGLIGLVVGVGIIVVVVHDLAIMTANPATLQFPISPHSITNKSNILPRSGLVQQVGVGDAE